MGASFVIDHRNLWDVCVNSRCCVNLALRMCFDTSIISLNALASKHDLSTRQARRHQKTTAFCVVWQLRVIAETAVRMMQQTHTHGPIKMGCVFDYLMADLRLTWSDRFGTANYIFSMRRCCLDPGCFRKIALRISSEVQYLDNKKTAGHLGGDRRHLDS